MSQSAKTDYATSASDVPVISIGMPIFNAGRCLRAAVLSIVQQSFTRWELIIIDDASTDGALDSIRDLDDPRIKIVEGTDNRGLASRLNEAVGFARGAYFARMDQDDISHPERLARQLDFLESQRDVDVVGTRCVLIDEEDQASGILEFPENHDDVCRRPWRGILMPHPTWMGKTEWFRQHHYRSPGSYFCEDQELLLRTHQTARFAVLPESLLAYRVKGPVPTAKILRTRTTLAALQFRHFLGKARQLDALKAVGVCMAKCAHDIAAPLVGLSARSASAGVPLVAMTPDEVERWRKILPGISAEAASVGSSKEPAQCLPDTETEHVDNNNGARPSEIFLRPRTFWILAFIFACLQALMVQKLALPLVPSLHGGHGLLVNDAIVFHEAAVAAAERINSMGWSEWSLYPPKFSGNVGVLSALYAIFGPEPALFIPFNAAAHATGALMLYLMGPLLWPGRNGWLGGLIAASLFVAFPSSLQWYSQNHKDAFTIAGSLMLLYVWLLLVSGRAAGCRRAGTMLFLALVGLALVLVMRPYLSMPLGAAFLFSALVCWIWSFLGKSQSGPISRKPWELATFLGIVCAGALIGSSLPASETATLADFNKLRSRVISGSNHEWNSSITERVINWRWRPALTSPLVDSAGSSRGQDAGSSLRVQGDLNGYSPRKFFDNALAACWRTVEVPFKRISGIRVHFVAHGISVGAGSGIDEYSLPDNLFGSLLYMPRALMVGAFAPFPATWVERVSLFRLAGAAETFIWYIFFIGTLGLVFKRPSQTLVAGIAFCALLFTIFSYTNPNVGTLHRARFGYWMFVLLCGSVGWFGVVIPALRRIVGGRDGKESKQDQLLSSDPRPTISGLESLGASGAAVMAITFICFLGFLGRDLLLINMEGMGDALDAFFTAAILPMVFVTCLTMPLADVLTKPFIAASTNGDTSRATETIRASLAIGCLIVAPCAALLWAFPGTLLGAVLGIADQSALQDGSTLLRIMTPIVIASVFNIVGNAVLNARGKSPHAAAAQLIVPTLAISAIVIAPREQALLASAAGMLVGAILNALIVSSLCRREGTRLFPLWSLESICRIDLLSYFWLALAASFTALAVPVNFYFAALVGSGSVSAWAFAGKFVILFNSLFSFGVTAVVLPHLAAKFAAGDHASGRDHFFFLLVAGTWIGGVVALALAIFAEPLVYGVFNAGGQLSQDQIASLATVFRIGALQVPVAIAGAIVLKSVVVSGSSTRAVIGSFAGLIVNILINNFFAVALGLQAIAVGALLATMVTTLVAYSGSRASYGASAWVGVILLFGWLVWAGAAWAIDTKNALALTGSAVGLLVLAALHIGLWRNKLYHRSSLRQYGVSR